LEKQPNQRKKDVRNTKRPARLRFKDFVKLNVPDGGRTVREILSKREEISKSDVIEKWRLESKAWLTDKLNVTGKAL
jgi:hypothetical protein